MLYRFQIFLFGINFMKITADTHMTDVLKSSPKMPDVLKKYGLPCARCRGASQDTVFTVSDNYSIDLKTFLADLNSALV